MPEEETPQAPTPATEPTTFPQEATPAPIEPEPAQSEPAEIPTAQIPLNEPLPPEPEPIETTPEPPSSAASTSTPAHPIRDFLNKARVAIQDRKRKKRDKIMQALITKSKITNDEVEKLLHVSDATATRYLSALEKEGKIKQVGKTGKAVVYSKI